MSYIYTVWKVSTNCTKALRTFKKPRGKKSDMKKVHNPKYRHSLGVDANII
jgi:hypothetical protein